MSGNMSSDNRNVGQHASPVHAPASVEGQFSPDARIVVKEAWLSELGYTAQEISEIRQASPDMNIEVLKAPPEDARVYQVVLQARAFASLDNTVVVFKLHDVALAVSGSDGIEDSVARYMAKVPPGPVMDLINRQEAEREERFNAAREQLPEFLRDWLGKYSGEGQNVEHNTHIAQDAALIARVLQTPEAIQKWYDITDTHKQNQIVPGLWELHSGMSFGLTKRLAVAYLKSLDAAN